MLNVICLSLNKPFLFLTMKYKDPFRSMYSSKSSRLVAPGTTLVIRTAPPTLNTQTSFFCVTLPEYNRLRDNFSYVGWRSTGDDDLFFFSVLSAEFEDVAIVELYH